MEANEKSLDELGFDLDECKAARLVCNTVLENGWEMEFGFTAEKKFYATNGMNGYHAEWIHDESMLKLQHYLNDDNDDSITMILKYDSIHRANITAKIDEDGFGFEAAVLVVVQHSPLFKYRFWNASTSKYDHGRYFKQFYSNEVNGFWNDLINATAFKIYFKMDQLKFYSWMRQLFARFPCSIGSEPIASLSYYPGMNRSGMALCRHFPFKAKFYVKCIESFGTIGEFLLNYYLFEQNDIQILQNLANQRRWNLIETYFCGLFKFLKKDISLLSLNFDANDFCEYSNPEKYVSIFAAIITPTKTIFVGEEETSNNRSFRKLGIGKMLQLKFRDEDGLQFPRDSSLLNEKMRHPLINGISVGGKMFRDFGSSSSMFRQQHGTYFFEANTQKEIVKIINQWAVFKKEPAAKVAARLGLYFSSATEIQMKLRSNEIGFLEEFVTSPRYSPQYTFSDGIGIIDVGFARQIQEELGLPTMPTAFQFRCMGCKGMVAIDPYNKNLVSNGGPFIVMFRDSQMKFQTFPEKEIDFEMIKFSAPAPLKSHKSFIALLAALARDQGKLDIVEGRFHEFLTQTFLNDIIKPLYDSKAFARTLRTLPKHFPLDKFYPEQLIQEDFFRSIVEVNIVNLGKQLNSKAQIPIPESLGRSVLGVIDEYGILGPNQIFLQISAEIYSKSRNPKTRVITGKVGVTKSPMYHLGDIRYVQGIDHPKLRHHLDVIVFSRYGDRPLPDMIGGGDLDGDCYSVFWDIPLLMEHYEAADFPSPDTSYLPKVNIDQLHHSHADFRIEYEQQNNLEQLSNLFINHITLQHPEHPEIQQISAKADIAVNSFKSGIFAPEIERHERVVYHPNYCNKRHEPSFDCDHILSQLHKRSTKIYLQLQLMQDYSRKNRLEAKIKNIEVSDYATDMFDKYYAEINELMTKHNIKSEAELFCNVILDPVGSLNTYKFKKDYEEEGALIQSQLSEIIGRFRRQLLDKFKNNWQADMFEKDETLATYTIPVYEITDSMRQLGREFKYLSENDKRILSFQYLLIEALELKDSLTVDRSVTNINEMLNNFDYDAQNYSHSVQPEDIEGRLIQIAFQFQSTNFNQPSLTESIIQFPSFVISVPEFYKDGFVENYKTLKKMTGVHDIAVRSRKVNQHFQHFTILCEGTLSSCLNLERLLTPYLEYEQSNAVSLDMMKKRKSYAMKEVLQNVFGFQPPPPRNFHHTRSTPAILGLSNRNHFPHSSTTPARLDDTARNRKEDDGFIDGYRNQLQTYNNEIQYESYDRQGPSPWRDYIQYH